MYKRKRTEELKNSFEFSELRRTKLHIKISFMHAFSFLLHRSTIIIVYFKDKETSEATQIFKNDVTEKRLKGIPMSLRRLSHFF